MSQLPNLCQNMERNESSNSQEIIVNKAEIKQVQFL